MFVTKNQIFIFIACVAFGGVSGILFSLSALFKLFIKNRLLKMIPDVIASMPLSVCFIFYAYSLNFPNLRPYMLFGVFVGLLLYFKSFHIILAKTVQKIYNIYKSKKEKRVNDRRKGKRCLRLCF